MALSSNHSAHHRGSPKRNNCLLMPLIMHKAKLRNRDGLYDISIDHQGIISEVYSTTKKGWAAVLFKIRKGSIETSRPLGRKSGAIFPIFCIVASLVSKLGFWHTFRLSTLVKPRASYILAARSLDILIDFMKLTCRQNGSNVSYLRIQLSAETARLQIL